MDDWRDGPHDALIEKAEGLLAEVGRLEGLILDWSAEMDMGDVDLDAAGKMATYKWPVGVLEAEARRIRAQREGVKP